MNSLGELSERGMGLPQDDRTARSWYKKAADLGDADAMGNLGALFENGRGGPRDLETARQWYVKGAALNGRRAMHNLAAMLEHGRGAAKNLAEAKLWYERAAALEYPPALNELGRLYLLGIGIAKNYELARASFEQAADLGDANAMNNLGTLYVYGRGVQRDIGLARMWFKKAVSLDNAEAQRNLKRLDEAGLVGGMQIAERRATCMQTCVSLQRSYVNSVCEPFSGTLDGDSPERTRCIDVGFSLARRCRDSCREWAPTLLAQNRCLACFEDSIACSSRGGKAETEQPRDCLLAHADCMANCSAETIPVFGISESETESRN
jgi:TPR repeat protein